MARNREFHAQRTSRTSAAGAVLVGVLTVWLALAVLRATVDAADRPAAPPTNEPATESTTADSASPDRPPPDPRTPTIFFAALALVGILLSGLALVAMVLIWGRRVRRLARELVATSAPRDEFWYLRPKKKTLPSDEVDGPDRDAGEAQRPDGER